MSRLLSAKALWAFALLSVCSPHAAAQFQTEYFSGTDFDSSIRRGEDWKIDFDWGSDAPAEGVPDDQFSVRWTGQLVPNETGQHIFHVRTDDGGRLYVGGQLIHDNWVNQTAQETDVPVELVAGTALEIVMECFDAGGQASARLEWTPPSGVRRAFTPGLLTGQDELVPFEAFHGGALPPSTPGPGGLFTTAVTPSLSMGMILTITAPPVGDELYVGSRAGRVRIVQPSDGTVENIFMDISDRVWTGQDSGLLGLAFHPHYADAGSEHEGELYAYYVHQRPADDERFLRLSRFTADIVARTVDTGTEEILIQQRVQATLHRGGGLLFGHDGFLYLTIGDLGMPLRAQQLNELFVGCLLRIDVDQDLTRSHPIQEPLDAGDPDTFGQGYTIPDDNPFVAAGNGTLEEVYALGLRNPHRMTMDQLTGELWIGDVGSNTGASQEEVNRIVAGGNYGWPFREAYQDIADRPDDVLGELTDPVVAYPRSLGSCIIGGYVYRGSQIPWLQGRYVFGDYSTGNLHATLDDLATFDGEALGSAQAGLVTFGQGADGELYIGAGNSVLYRVDGKPFGPEPPATLSATGLFQDLASLEPSAGFLPYDVNAPLWSDGALKRRWFAVPQDGSADDPQERIGFEMHDPWSFPVGSVFLKHFELPLEGGSVRRLETRVMVRSAGDHIYGVTYRWRPDGSDADLLTEPLSETIGDLTWEYPGREDCLRCHNGASGSILGLRTDQLNRDTHYGQRTGHQLMTLRELGLFEDEPSLEAIAHAPGRVELADLGEFAVERARSYVATNCASCHLPGGPGYGNFDARHSVPLANQGIVEGAVINTMGIANAHVLTPGMPESSLLLQRMLLEGELAMPTLGRGPVHLEGAAGVTAWVQAQNPIGAHFQSEFFEGTNFEQPLLTRTDATLAFDWDSGSPDPAVPSDGFSARFSGSIVPPTSEVVTFITTSDDGVRVFVDNQLVVDDWGNHGARERRGQIELQAGVAVPVVVEYYENAGKASLRLDWYTPSRGRRVVQAVDPANTPPTAFDVNHSLERNLEVTFELEGSDPQGSSLDFALRQMPENGQVIGQGASLVYRPDFGFVGADRLTYVAFDGSLESEEREITFDVLCYLCEQTEVYCSTSPNSVGAGALISASGSTSVASEDLTLHVEGLPPSDFGMFFYGVDQIELPFGEGLRCVGSGGLELFRLPVQMADATGRVDYVVDYQAVEPHGWIQAGSSWNFQYWYRDPAGGTQGFNLSNALSAEFLQ